MNDFYGHMYPRIHRESGGHNWVQRTCLELLSAGDFESSNRYLIEWEIKDDFVGGLGRNRSHENVQYIFREKERHSIDGNPPMGYRSGQMLYYF